MKLPSLLIPIDEIPEPGLVRKGELPAEWLGDTLLDPYTASGPLVFQLEVRRMDANVLVEGHLDLDLAFQCSRTLEPGSTHLRVRLGELFQPASSHSMKFSDGLDADEVEADEIYAYEGSTIDLEPFVREQLVLAQDPYPVVEARAALGDDADASPVWTSDGGAIDPRWEALKDLKIN